MLDMCRRWIKRIRRHLPRLEPPSLKVPLYIHILNPYDVCGGTIWYAPHNDASKWKPLAKWGVKTGRDPSKPIKVMLPYGLSIYVRANCGPPELVTPGVKNHVHLTASGCYGSTDNLPMTLKRVAVVHVFCHETTLFGVDNTIYAFAAKPIGTTIFLKPGSHTLYFPKFRNIRLNVKAGRDYKVRCKRWA